IVESVNEDIGMITVDAEDDDFAAEARKLTGVDNAAAEISVGSAPVRTGAAPDEDVLKEHQQSSARKKAKGAAPSTGRAGGPKAKTADPLDENLWAHDMLEVDRARSVTAGDERVKVGVLDTGIQANHPDIAGNFDRDLSKNFARDIPMIDGD